MDVVVTLGDEPSVTPDRYHRCNDARARFWAKVRKDEGTGCWEWTAARTVGGYGRFTAHKGYSPALTHRYAYEMLVGPIPVGMQLDHLCRNRSCCNPAHLEPVSHAENQRRGAGFAGRAVRQTHCIHGHEFDGVDEKGARRCGTCARRRTREYMRAWRKRRTAARAAARAAAS